MSTEGELPTRSHQGGTSDPMRMNLNETLRSLQQSIKGLARQFQSVARDVEYLKRGKSSATIEQRVGDNFGGVNSPHHQRLYDNMSTQGYHDMSVHNPYPFHEGEDKMEVDIIDHMKRFQDMKHGMRIICLKILERILMFAKHIMMTIMHNLISHFRFSPSQTTLARGQSEIVTNGGSNRRIHREQTKTRIYREEEERKEEGSTQNKQSCLISLQQDKDKSIYTVSKVDSFKQQNSHLEGSFNNRTS
ncbi:hypothetical protein M9H77_23452 [Catharanthus roseus]|uniref:Uncharacterized protein n=1 Tax=Catharanthus roseus TaxID=4058 RepID=A0ACC0AUB1_CATRO|nr:hypothetical protein M9H77_23452 [Catharanthus roseus]